MSRVITPSVAELAGLQRAIAGQVVLPDSARYEVARRPPIARFEDIRPQAVVLCRTSADVAETLSLVRRSGASVAIRSGGHCFAGRSSTDGILIDVSPMNAVAVADGVASVGAGARLGEVYDALSERGLTIAAGCGPTVGIAGLALGGGLGILGRRHGLTCDQLVGAEVVLADGRVIECDKRHDPDLFWALRGAGGGQFGVVTKLVLRTLPAPAASALHLSWAIGDGPALVEAWQAWAPPAPDELAASLLAVAGADPAEPPAVHVFGAMLDSKAATEEVIDALIAAARVPPTAAHFESAPYRGVKRYLSEHGPGEAVAGPSPEHAFAKSEFFARPLPTATIAALIAHFSDRRAAGQRRTLDFTPWGGAYNRVSQDATAFAHRGQRFLLKHDVAVAAGAPIALRRDARAWLARSWEIVHPSGSGGVYPNFPDPELGDAASAYHGPNLGRLHRVKATYDPDNLFRFHQSLRS